MRTSFFALIFIASPAFAQVGHMPDNSPYRDLEFKHEITWFGGYFHAQRDPVAVGPKPGPMFGLRYDLLIAGPAHLYGRVSGITTERTRINPALATGSRELGTSKLALLETDLGVTMNLTGQRSIYHLVPTLSAGAGFFSDLGRKEDEGGFRFGTPFAFALGGGVRFVPGGRIQFRLDYTDHLYKVRYPEQYFITAAGSTPVLTDTRKRSVWTNNAGITLGASYTFYR